MSGLQLYRKGHMGPSESSRNITKFQEHHNIAFGCLGQVNSLISVSEHAGLCRETIYSASEFKEAWLRALPPISNTKKTEVSLLKNKGSGTNDELN